MKRAPTRQAIGIASLALAAAVTGCGSATSGNKAVVALTTARAQVNSAAARSVQCSPARLRLIRQGLVSEATEQHAWIIGILNTSATGCDLDGYPGITLLNSHGNPLPYDFRRGGDQMLTSAAPALVRLPPHGNAYFGINKNVCIVHDLDLATGIRVTPPGARSALTLLAPNQRIMDYCGHGDPGSVVDITPVEPDVAAVLAHH